MLLHAGEDKVARGGLVAVLKEPAGALLVPDGDVPDDGEVMLLGEGDEGVGLVEGELALGALDGVGLHAVAGGDAVEVLIDELQLGG